MGIIDELSRALAPHSDKMKQTLDSHGALLHYRLKRIEDGISTLGRPDVGDTYHRHTLSGKFVSGETELFTVRMNEIYPVQFITINGLVKKTPAFTIRVGGSVIFAFNAEGVGTETSGGDVVFLPGERVVISMSEEGEVDGTIGMVRVRINDEPRVADFGPSEELLASRNTHNPNRDVIASPNGIYDDIPQETVDSGGNPVITR